MKKILLTLMAVVALTSLHSCKTTEANYRAAYEIAREKQLDGGDSLVTEGLKNELLPRTLVVGGVSLPVRTETVIVTSGRGVDVSELKVYNVVAASFKQLFNAGSFCDRLRAEGFNAFLVENRDKTYYVVALSTREPQEAADGLEKLRGSDAVVCRKPFPYVLRAGQLVR